MKAKNQTLKLLEKFIFSISLGLCCQICSAEILTDTQETHHYQKYFSNTINKEQYRQYKQHPVLDKGIFLIAGHNLNDPNFSKTVILITNYDNTGTTGLIINKQTDVPVNMAIPDLDKSGSTDKYLNLGGPVAINFLTLLVYTDINLPPAQSRHIFSNVYLINRTELLDQLIQEEKNNQFYKLYIGYAGWSAGQLETELLRGDWYIWHADVENIFNKPSEGVWNELINRVTEKWVMR